MKFTYLFQFKNLNFNLFSLIHFVLFFAYLNFCICNEKSSMSQWIVLITLNETFENFFNEAFIRSKSKIECRNWNFQNSIIYFHFSLCNWIHRTHTFTKHYNNNLNALNCKLQWKKFNDVKLKQIRRWRMKILLVENFELLKIMNLKNLNIIWKSTLIHLIIRSKKLIILIIKNLSIVFQIHNFESLKIFNKQYFHASSTNLFYFCDVEFCLSYYIIKTILCYIILSYENVCSKHSTA